MSLPDESLTHTLRGCDVKQPPSQPPDSRMNHAEHPIALMTAETTNNRKCKMGLSNAGLVGDLQALL